MNDGATGRIGAVEEQGVGEAADLQRVTAPAVARRRCARRASAPSPAASGRSCGTPSTSSESSRATEKAPRLTSPTRCSLAVSSERHAAERDVRRARRPPVVEGARRGTRRTVRSAASASTTSRSAGVASSGRGVHARGRAYGIAGAAAAVAAIEDRHDVGPARRHLGDQQRQLLVGERPAQLAVDAPPAVVEHDRLDPPARLEVGDRRRRRLLAAVAGVGEEGHVAVAGACEVLAEPGDHRVARWRRRRAAPAGRARHRRGPAGRSRGRRCRCGSRTAASAAAR